MTKSDFSLTVKPKVLSIAKWLHRNKGGRWTYSGHGIWWCDDGVRHVSRVATDCMDENSLAGYYLYGGDSPGWIHF